MPGGRFASGERPRREFCCCDEDVRGEAERGEAEEEDTGGGGGGRGPLGGGLGGGMS
jgi:hypothetical protein